VGAAELQILESVEGGTTAFEAAAQLAAQNNALQQPRKRGSCEPGVEAG
jgi:hypothetical protein